MAKTVKLTDEDYLRLKELARADGLALAGEIRKMINLQRIINVADVLGAVADRLEAAPPVPERPRPTENRKSPDIDWGEIAKEMGYMVDK